MTSYHFSASNYMTECRMKCVNAVCLGLLLNSPSRLMWRCARVAVDEHDVISLASEQKFKMVLLPV